MSEEASKAEPAPQEAGGEPEGEAPQPKPEAEAPQPEPQQAEQKEGGEDTSKEEQQGDQPADSAEPTEQEPEGEKKEEEQAAAAEPEPVPKQEEPEKEEEQLADDEEPEDGVPIVLVTGASGFVATHIIQQLLQQGRFRVRGTVRSLKNQDKVQPLRDLVADAKYPLRLVEADLEKPKTWQLAVKRCAYVFHVASPFPIKQPKNADVLIRPAVEGTLNVLRACSEAGTVKRVALTSSVAAVSSGMAGNPGNPPDYVYTEKDWSDEPTCSPYEKSKLRAERAAWDFVKELKEEKSFELAVLNPGYIQGPVLTKSSGSGSSAELCRVLLNNKGPLVNVNFAIVDVRDVAAAHIAAIEKDDAAGQRHILVSSSIHMQQVAALVDAEFKPQGYKVPRKVLGKAASWIGKFVNTNLKAMYKDLGKSIKHSDERMRGVLGVEARTIEDTLRDTCYSLIDLGVVKKTPGYLGHPSTRPPPPPEEEQQQETKEEDKPQEPTQEEAKTEEPAQEQQQAQQEEEKKEEPAAEEPPKEEAPKEEPPKEEPPKEEPPKEEPPKEEPPKEEPQEEAPKEEPPKEEPPKEEPPKEEPPKEEPPKEEPPKEEPPKEEPPQEEPSPAEPQQEEEQKPAEPEPKSPPPPQEEQEEPPKEATPPPEPTQELEPEPEPSQEET